MTRIFVLARWWVSAAFATIFVTMSAATSAIAFATIFAITFASRASAQGTPLDAPLPPDEAAQKQILADIKAKALEYDQNLPDFACTQFSHHSLDAKGLNQWKTLDTVSEQLRFVHRIEEYSLIAQNGKKASGSERRAANLISLKEFSDVIRDIFDPKAKVDMAWTQWDSVRGHRVHMITFLVKKDNSLYTVGKSKGLQSGIAGFIYADADTNAVVRVAMAATDLPKTYAIQAVSTDIHYDFARIGDKIYLLPLKADFREKEGKRQVWDEVELKDFRKP